MRSYNHCCNVKAVSVKNHGFVSVALFIQREHLHAPHFIAICALSDSTIFLQFISRTARFSKKKKKVIEHKVVFDFLYIFYEIFLTLRRSKRVIIINEHRFACKVPVISVKF